MAYVDFLKHAGAFAHRLPDEPADGTEDNLRLLLSHVNQKGVRATLVRFLRRYAGAKLPDKATAIDPVLLRNVVKKTETHIGLELDTWSFTVRKRIPGDVCRNSSKVQLFWQDQECKSFDCALARTCLADVACESTSPSGAEDVWEFAKAIVKAYDTLQSSSPATPLTVASLAVKTVRLSSHNSLENVSFSDWWKKLRDDDKLLMLREVVCQWFQEAHEQSAPCPLSNGYIGQAMPTAYNPAEDWAENTSSAKRQKTRSTGATAGPTDQIADQGTSCSAGAYRGMLPDTQDTATPSASKAVDDWYEWLPMSQQQQLTERQEDADGTATAPEQGRHLTGTSRLPLGRSRVTDAHLSSETWSAGLLMTAHIQPDPCGIVDTTDGIIDIQAATNSRLDEFTQLSNGSLRLNVYTAASAVTDQAGAASALMQRIMDHLGSTVGFTLTLHVADSSIKIAKDIGPRTHPQLIPWHNFRIGPAILAAHISDHDCNTMVVSGHYLTGGCIWCFQDHALKVEYLLEKTSAQVVASQPVLLPQLAQGLSHDREAQLPSMMVRPSRRRGGVLLTDTSTPQLQGPSEKAVAVRPLEATKATVHETPRLSRDSLELAIRDATSAQSLWLRHAPGQENMYLQVPDMLVKGGRFWLQAERDGTTSAPLALPVYSGPAKQAGVNQQQGMWKRFMYPLCASRPFRDAVADIQGPKQVASPILRHQFWADQAASVTLLHAGLQCTEGQEFLEENLIEHFQHCRDWKRVDILNARSRWGHHALHYAAANPTLGPKMLKAVEDLLINTSPQSPFVVDVRDVHGCTPLHWAARTGSITAVEWLLKLGASPSAEDYFRATPLHYAALSPAHAQQALMSALLQGHADVGHTDKNKQTALHWLMSQADLQSSSVGSVQVLLNAAADIHATDALGNTPLHCAAASCKVFKDISGVLLNHGAALAAVNVFGDNVAHTAAGFGNLNALQALSSLAPLEEQSLLSHKNNAGMTPLQLAIAVGWSVSVVDFLLQRHSSKPDDTALLELLVRTGWRQEIVRVLVSRCNADGVEVRTIWPALHLLAQAWQVSGGLRRSKLQIRFANTVTPANCQVRQCVFAALVKLANF